MEVGLVEPSDRTTGGFGLYPDADIDRLRLVKLMKPLGFSLEEMRDMLDLRESLRGVALEGDERERALDRLATYATSASARIDELRTSLESAEQFVAALRSETAATGPRR